MTHPSISTNPNALELTASQLAWVERYRDWPENGDDHTIVVPPEDRTIVVPPEDRTIVVPPEDRTIVVPPRTPDDCVVALPDGQRFWVSLPPPVQALLPHGTGVPAALLLGRRCHRPHVAVPDGLRTRAQAAAKLGCSLRTLDGHVASGALRYVAIGHGKTRPRKMFTDADLDEFITNQTRKDAPCPSTARRARRSGSTIFGGEVIAYTALRSARPGAKPKK